MTILPAIDLDAEIAACMRRRDVLSAVKHLQNWLDDPANEPTLAYYLQLAGFRRALRQPRLALDAVHRALAISPFDFTALVLRASLLVRLEDPGAGVAWGEALAQRPTGTLPPPLAAAVEEGERISAGWLAERERQLVSIAALNECNASDDERWRINRFRDNILHKTKIYHSSPTHFHYPGLVEREFHPRERFPWLIELETATEQIRAEMQGLMRSERAEMLPYVQYQEHEALEQWRPLNHNLDWTAMHLFRQGQPVAEHVQQCPVTVDILRRCGQPDIPGASPNAMFSLLAPNTTIPPHVGVNNARLVCHLPLVVPPDCWFRVGAETRYWREGDALIFDDTIEHEAANPSDQLRVVLIFDIWHPDLSVVERETLAAMIAAENRG